MQMETSTRASGKTIWPTGSEPTSTRMELYTRGTGLRISRKERVKRSGLMVLSMKVITNQARKKVVAFFDGPTDPPMKDNYKTTTCRALAVIPGLTTESMRANGRLIRCTERVPFGGLMEGSTKESTEMTKRMGRGCSHGQMDASTREGGMKANSMAKECSSPRMVN